ncbi:MAG: hypothetical protein JSV21_06200 [Nitrospirota bacterium]|nr:MAG: hypothetical protein JSV21_06200 [Nitrospirota bacterium]
MSIIISDIENIYEDEFVGNNGVEVFHEGCKAFDDIFNAIDSAERSVLLAFYIFKDDLTGQELAGLLKKKAAQGLRVCILYDHFGSFSTQRKFWRELKDGGVALRASHPFKWRAIGEYIRRDHRKLIVIDGKITYTGGLNIGDEYRGFGMFKHKERGWRDTVVKATGPVSEKLYNIYRITWKYWGGDPIPELKVKVAFEKEGGYPALPIFSSSSRGRRMVRKLLYWCIMNAESSICLTTAYFIPSRRMLHILRDAAGRGVKVRLMLPGISDIKAVMYAGRATFTKLLEWGVEIYLYNKTVLHAKSYIFDSIFSIVGSANLDFQSLRKNDEGNIGVYGGGFSEEMQGIFNIDIGDSEQIILEKWRNRPVLNKLLEKLFVMFRRRL